MAGYFVAEEYGGCHGWDLLTGEGGRDMGREGGKGSTCTRGILGARVGREGKGEGDIEDSREGGIVHAQGVCICVPK